MWRSLLLKIPERYIMRKLISALFSTAILATTGIAQATPTITSLGGDLYKVQFDPVSFNVTTSGQLASVVFKDFFASNTASCGLFQSGTVQVSVNGSSMQNLNGNSCTGAYNYLNDVSGNDLLVTFYSGFTITYGNVTAGDLVTASATDYEFSLSGLNAALNPNAKYVYLVNNSFQRVSDTVTIGSSPVPEPGTLAIFSLSMAALAASRRKKSV
jgi:hypothetical protein